MHWAISFDPKNGIKPSGTIWMFNKMKSIGLALFFLLCTVTWITGEVEEVEDVEDNLDESDADALPIIAVFTYTEGDYALSLYNKVNWYQAQLLCQSQGYTLVTIPSETMQNRIRNFIRTQANSQLASLSTDQIWTSGTNQAVNTQYVWHGSGQPVSYRNYASSPPTNTSRCIGINGVTGYWYDLDCRQQRYFLCEKLEQVTCT